MFPIPASFGPGRPQRRPGEGGEAGDGGDVGPGPACEVPSPDGDHRAWDLNDPRQHPHALQAAYTDNPLLTQLDARGDATSSSTAPSLMALMLNSLDVRDGHRVLEIGTGTGYNAALLTHRLGDEHVTTIDMHPDLVDAARTALTQAGYRPTIVCGDGAAGYPQQAPYDRIIATCGVPRVPTAWLPQVRPGGLIMANIGYALARLTINQDGTASGPFIGYASFMPMRSGAGDLPPTGRDVLDLACDPGPSPPS